MKQQVTEKRIAMQVIMGAGFLLRLFYVCFSSIYDRQYDIGMMDLNAGHTVSGGHLAYIQYLYENLRLPDVDPTTVYQFHHPPLAHAMSALCMRAVSLFTKNTEVIQEAAQIFPFLCSLAILAVLVRILDLLPLSEESKCGLMFLFGMHPALVLLSGSVNNDCPALLFTLLCVYFTMRWVRDCSMKNILCIALAIGLGMSAKQNVAEMAFPIGLLFLWELVERVRKNREKLPELLCQFAAFGAVSLPLGMWFYVRNLVRYGMSMMWVYELPADSWQYTGNVPLVNRFLWPIPSEMVDNLLHFKIGCGYNVWMQILRTSVLGEWDMMNVGRGVKLLAVFLMLLGGVLAAFSLVCFLCTFLGIGKTGRRLGAEIGIKDRVFFLLSYLVTMLFYFSFAYQYPQQCSMHFRYIEITLLFPAVGLGLAARNITKRWLNLLLKGVLAAFALCSVAMLCVWCLG